MVYMYYNRLNLKTPYYNNKPGQLFLAFCYHAQEKLPGLYKRLQRAWSHTAIPRPEGVSQSPSIIQTKPF